LPWKFSRHFLFRKLSDNQVYLFGHATKQRDEGGAALKVLESPIGLITQKRSDEQQKKTHIKKLLTHSRAHCQKSDTGFGD
jgi:hypothetical protein